MSQSEREAIAAICLLAAFADGQPDDNERQRIRTIMDGLSAEGAPGSGVSNQVYQRVIFKQTDVAREAAQLSTPEIKQFAYEMAVSVCDADGSSSPAEKTFLASLAHACGIAPAQAAESLNKVDLIADAHADAIPAAGIGAAAGTAPIAPPAIPISGPSAMDKEIEGSIMNYSILNGALELLPQGLATAAIIPLQMKMVYEIGKRYGYTLDKGHIKDFLATAGVGMTSQVVESFTRRLVGGVIENVGRRFVGRTAAHMIAGLGERATSTGMTFASTYALGHVARQYYAGGRTLSAIDLRSVFTKQMASAQQMYTQYRPQIEAQAQKVNPMQLLSLVRG